MNQHHYYGTTGSYWRIAATRDAVIIALAKDEGARSLQRALRQSGGIWATVMRVELPEAAHYSISNYVPSLITKEDGVNDKRKGELVPIGPRENVRITSMKGATIPAEE